MDVDSLQAPASDIINTWSSQEVVCLKESEMGVGCRKELKIRFSH